MNIDYIAIYLPNINELYPNMIDRTEGAIIIHFLNPVTTEKKIKKKINLFLRKKKKPIQLTFINHVKCTSNCIYRLC